MDQFELGPRQKQLVDALRSGKYKQGFKRLRDGDCYCVDGVVCDLSGLGSWVNDDYQFQNYDWGYTGFMPEEVREHFQIKFRLWTINDIDKLSFEQIANKLEAEPQEYFHEPV